MPRGRCHGRFFGNAIPACDTIAALRTSDRISVRASHTTTAVIVRQIRGRKLFGWLELHLDCSKSVADELGTRHVRAQLGDVQVRVEKQQRISDGVNNTYTRV